MVRFTIGSVLLFAVSLNPVCAQIEQNYIPRSTHTASSKGLIDTLRQLLHLEAEAIEVTSHSSLVNKINSERVNHLIKTVKDEHFINDHALESYVNGVLNKILKGNSISLYRRVLVLRSPQINAFCYGHGIYIITAGLLGRISSEDELAFVLAHEVAHDVFGHIKENILREADINLQKKTKQQVTKILSGTVELEDIEEFRKLIYGISRYDRVKEMQADSLGLILLNNAHYDENYALSLLTKLDSALSPKFNIGVDLFLPLHADKYPLKDYWFNKRLSLFERKHTDSFLYSSDSIKDHPDIQVRMQTIQSYFNGHEFYENEFDQAFTDAVTTLAEFETVECAYRNRTYDLSLYYALQLLHRYPKNAFLISRIGKILVDSFEAKSNNTFHYLVPRYTTDYSEELKLINNMLYNLSATEMGEVAFYFLDNPAHFNNYEKGHYYLLWKISDLTYRNDVKDEIKKAYREKFAENITVYSYK